MSTTETTTTTETTATGPGDDRRTPLYEEHRRLGAKMIPFGGWEMPVNYPGGIIAEHRAVRERAGLFDLGHMGQVQITGPDAEGFVQRVGTNDLSRVPEGMSQYSVLCREGGGAVDDIFVYRLPGRVFICLNAANAAKDVAWLASQRSKGEDDCAITNLSETLGMLAVQGPRAVEIVSRLTDADLDALPRFGVIEADVAGVPTIIGRTGYTGEDGVELYPPLDATVPLWQALMEAGEGDGLVPVGLGARDTLRLEAKMALYGHELTEEITPLEAALSWAVAFDKGDFIGRDALLAVKEAGGPQRRLVGFRMEGRPAQRAPVARADYRVQVGGEDVGTVTSGGFGPTVNANIGLALVRRDVAGVGKPLDIIVRDKPVAAVQVRTPFYKKPDAPVGL